MKSQSREKNNYNSSSRSSSTYNDNSESSSSNCSCSSSPTPNYDETERSNQIRKIDGRGKEYRILYDREQNEVREYYDNQNYSYYKLNKEKKRWEKCEKPRKIKCFECSSTLFTKQERKRVKHSRKKESQQCDDEEREEVCENEKKGGDRNECSKHNKSRRERDFCKKSPNCEETRKNTRQCDSQHDNSCKNKKRPVVVIIVRRTV